MKDMIIIRKILIIGFLLLIGGGQTSFAKDWWEKASNNLRTSDPYHPYVVGMNKTQTEQLVFADYLDFYHQVSAEFLQKKLEIESEPDRVCTQSQLKAREEIIQLALKGSEEYFVKVYCTSFCKPLTMGVADPYFGASSCEERASEIHAKANCSMLGNIIRLQEATDESGENFPSIPPVEIGSYVLPGLGERLEVPSYSAGNRNNDSSVNLIPNQPSVNHPIEPGDSQSGSNGLDNILNPPTSVNGSGGGWPGILDPEDNDPLRPTIPSELAALPRHCQRIIRNSQIITPNFIEDRIQFELEEAEDNPDYYSTPLYEEFVGSGSVENNPYFTTGSACKYAQESEFGKLYEDLLSAYNQIVNQVAMEYLGQYENYTVAIEQIDQHYLPMIEEYNLFDTMGPCARSSQNTEEKTEEEAVKENVEKILSGKGEAHYKLSEVIDDFFGVDSISLESEAKYGLAKELFEKIESGEITLDYVVRNADPRTLEHLASMYRGNPSVGSIILAASATFISPASKAKIIKEAAEEVPEAAARVAPKISKAIKDSVDRNAPKVIDSAKKIGLSEKENLKAYAKLRSEAKHSNSTSTRLQNYERGGGYDKAVQDWKRFKFERVIKNERDLKIGKTKDGTMIVVRKRSSGNPGKPTLEFQRPSDRKPVEKFRY